MTEVCKKKKFVHICWAANKQADSNHRGNVFFGQRTPSFELKRRSESILAGVTCVWGMIFWSVPLCKRLIPSTNRLSCAAARITRVTASPLSPLSQSARLNSISVCWPTNFHGFADLNSQSRVVESRDRRPHSPLDANYCCSPSGFPAVIYGARYPAWQCAMHAALQ